MYLLSNTLLVSDLEDNKSWSRDTYYKKMEERDLTQASAVALYYGPPSSFFCIVNKQKIGSQSFQISPFAILNHISGTFDILTLKN